MTINELKVILDKHRKWLCKEEGGAQADLSGADLRELNLECADLSYADLSKANLNGANLDYASFPIWCGGLHVNIDDRQAVQLLYHTLQNALESNNTSDELKNILSDEKLINLANTFHRVYECGKIENQKI